MFEFLKNYTSLYWGKYGYITLFLAALVILFIFEEDKKKRISYVWFPFISLFVIYNPVFVKVVKKLVGEKDFTSYYSKVYLMIPIMAVIAFAMTHIVAKANGVKKLLGLMAMILLIIVSGHCFYRETYVSFANNADKISDDILEISGFFDRETYGDGPITLAGPLDVTVSLRAVDGRFDSPYARGDDFTYVYTPDLAGEAPDVAKLFAYFYNHDNTKVYDNKLNAALADKNKEAGYANPVDYVVCNKSEKATDAFVRSGCEIIGYTTNYAILKINEYPDWIVTSYEDTTGTQGMCYTVRNIKTNQLIVIDGGNEGNADYLRGVIKEAGNVVDAWIVTHYHADHIGAFNKIYADPQGIEIKDVYVSAYDRAHFMSVAYQWDDLDFYNRFLTITENAKNIHPIAKNASEGMDTLVFDNDLKIIFFNTYNEASVENGSDDIGNNGALVFKVVGVRNSMLFMSDCHGKQMGEYFINTYGEQLQSTYLQAAHHGNNSTPEETGFYQLVNPKVAVFDAPEWLMTGEKYSAAKLKTYLEDMGCEVKDFTDGITAFGL